MTSCVLDLIGDVECTNDPSVIAIDGSVNLMSVIDHKQLEIRPSGQRQAPFVINNIGYDLGYPDVDAMTMNKVFFTKWADPNKPTAILYEFDNNQGRELSSWPGGAFMGVSYSQDKKYTAFYVWMNPKVKLIVLDLEKNQTILTKSYQAAGGAWWGPKLSNDGKKVVLFPYISNKIKPIIISLEKPDLTTELELIEEYKDIEPTTSVFSQDGSLLFIGFAKGQLGVFRVADGKLIKKIPGKGKQLRGLAISSDGRYLAITHNDGSIQIIGSSSGILPGRTFVNDSNPSNSSPTIQVFSEDFDQNLLEWQTGGSIKSVKDGMMVLKYPLQLDKSDYAGDWIKPKISFRLKGDCVIEVAFESSVRFSGLVMRKPSGSNYAIMISRGERNDWKNNPAGLGLLEPGKKTAWDDLGQIESYIPIDNKVVLRLEYIKDSLNVYVNNHKIASRSDTEFSKEKLFWGFDIGNGDEFSVTSIKAWATTQDNFKWN